MEKIIAWSEPTTDSHIDPHGWRHCRDAPDEIRKASDSRTDHHLDRLAIVHRPVAIGNPVQADDPVEDATRLDPSLQYVGEQLLDVRAHQGRATADGDVAEEGRLRSGHAVVMRHADAADRSTGAR